MIATGARLTHASFNNMLDFQAEEKENLFQPTESWCELRPLITEVIEFL